MHKKHNKKEEKRKRKRLHIPKRHEQITNKTWLFKSNT